MTDSHLEAVASVGGASLDRRSLAAGPLRPGTSNPVVSSLKPGGVARNVAEGLARLGCPSALFSIVGEDEAGRELAAGLQEAGVDLSGLTVSSSHPTGAYTAVLGPSGRLEFGLADMEIFEEADEAWVQGILPSLAKRRIWFVDANLPGASLVRLLENKPDGVTVLADPVSVAKAERLRPVLPAIDAVFPNRLEAEALSRLPGAGGVEHVSAAAEHIREIGVGSVIVTLGSGGACVDDGSGSRLLSAIAPHGPLSDVTGAGDALAAGYLFGLASGAGEPLRLGLAAASLVLEDGGSLAELSAERLAERARGES